MTRRPLGECDRTSDEPAFRIDLSQNLRSSFRLHAASIDQTERWLQKQRARLLPWAAAVSPSVWKNLLRSADLPMEINREHPCLEVKGTFIENEPRGIPKDSSPASDVRSIVHSIGGRIDRGQHDTV